MNEPPNKPTTDTAKAVNTLGRLSVPPDCFSDTARAVDTLRGVPFRASAWEQSVYVPAGPRPIPGRDEAPQPEGQGASIVR